MSKLFLFFLKKKTKTKTKKYIYKENKINSLNGINKHKTKNAEALRNIC